MSLDSLKENSLYKEFIDYSKGLIANNQRIIAHVRDFFESDEKFISTFIAAHKVWKKKYEELNEKYKKNLNEETDMKKKTQIKAKISNDAKKYADKNLIFWLDQIDAEKLRYHMRDEVPIAAFALFLNFLKTKKKKSISHNVDKQTENTNIDLTENLKSKVSWKKEKVEKEEKVLPPADLFKIQTREKEEQSKQAEKLKKQLNEPEKYGSKNWIQKGLKERRALEAQIAAYEAAINGLETPVGSDYEKKIQDLKEEIKGIERKYWI